MTTTTRRTRGAGLLPAAAFLIVLLTAAASGQLIEETIRLPDSLGGAYALSCMAYNPVDRTIYVGDQRDAVFVIDATTGKRVARIEAGFHVTALCCDTADNKVYVGWTDSMVKVIDCRTNTVTDSILVGRCPAGLCYVPAENKVYTANYGSSPRYDSTVSVIDCSTDSVIARIFVGARPSGLVYNSRHNKLYVGSALGTAVIDCAGDSLLAILDTIWSPFCYNPDHDKLYAGYWVLDGAGDTVVGHWWRGPSHVCYNSATGRAYGVWDDLHCTLMVMDGATDSLLTRFRLNPRAVWWFTQAVVANPRDGKAYIALSKGQSLEYDVAVIGGTPDTVLAWVPVGENPRALCWNEEQDEVYAMSTIGLSVAVIDGAGDSLKGVVYLGCGVLDLCLAPDDDKLFVLHTDNLGAVVAVDCEANRPTGMVRVGRWPQQLAYNPGYHKLYCSKLENSTVTVLDSRGDSVLAEVPVGRGPSRLVFNPRVNKLYSFRKLGGEVSVVCGSGDSLLRTIYPAPGGVGYSECVPATNKLYCSSPGGICVVECNGDSTVAEIAAETGAVTQICATPTGEKVYFGSGAARILTIVDGIRDTLIKTVSLGGEGGGMVYNHLNRRLYSADRDSARVVVFDCDADTVLRSVAVGERPRYLSFDSTTNRMYCSQDDGTAVIDCDRDSVITVLQPMFGLMVYDARHQRTYLSYDWSLLHVIKDTALGLADARGRTSPVRLHPTLARGSLRLSVAERGTLLDITGREVVELALGQNDIRMLPPGVYFVHVERKQVIGKLIVLP